MQLQEDDDFNWQDYLEQSKAEEVPNVNFPHVEQSLKSSFQEGMMLEIQDKHKPNKYWPAVIKMSCGPLLSLCYINPGRLPEFWCDLGQKVDVHPLGWCEEQSAQDPDTPVSLEPPDILKKLHPDMDWQDFARKWTEGKFSVPAELLTLDGYTAIDRIKQGMRIEVQDEKNPLHHWVATIIENVGGRLLLRYDSPDADHNDFWLFYTSTRLFRLGWADKKGLPWKYCPPSSLKISEIEDEWSSILQTALLEAELLAPSPDLFQDGVEIVCHELELGMKLEAVHPVNRIEICPATVTQLFETGHFLVKIDCLSNLEDNQELSWLCRPSDPFLFPAGWCKKNGLRLTHPQGWTTNMDDFDWEEYLNLSNSVSAPESFFTTLQPAIELGFDKDLKLEAVNPENPQQICAASISKIIGHLLWLHLDSEDNFHPSHIESPDSTNIFPVGWCGSNSYSLNPPRNYKAICQTAAIGAETKEASSQQEVSQKSSWCPKIYFNHKCFTGPFLSKGKLAQLPKAVGPGPVTLVMREVLSMLISVAYKSRQVLKEMQHEGPLPSDMHVEVLKAKLKSAVYRANVALVTSADKVPQYCKDVCAKLQSCPNLFGPHLFAENCPVGCSALSKSRFTNYWSKHKRYQSSSLDALKPIKRRGRKKLLSRSKTRSSAPDVGKNKRDKEEDEDSDECDSPSRSNSIDADDPKKKNYKKKLFPQFEMKTRGVKLPNFALQMSNWIWEKNSHVPAKKKQRLVSSDSIVPSHEKSRMKVKSSFSSSKHAPAVKLIYPRLESNPILWSTSDVTRYLNQTPDCGFLASRFAQEDIDGHAFMLLNLPTLQENFKLQLAYAIKLCQHIERVKYAYFSDFCNGLV